MIGTPGRLVTLCRGHEHVQRIHTRNSNSSSNSSSSGSSGSGSSGGGGGGSITRHDDDRDLDAAVTRVPLHVAGGAAVKATKAGRAAKASDAAAAAAASAAAAVVEGETQPALLNLEQEFVVYFLVLLLSASCVGMLSLCADYLFVCLFLLFVLLGSRFGSG